MLRRTAFLSGMIMLLMLAASVNAGGNDVLHPVAGKPLAAGFTLQDIEGKKHTLAAYRGKVVIVNFWASWCPPCRYELPSMERLWQKTRDKDVVLLAINIGENSDTIFTFTADYPVTFPLLMDTDSAVLRQYPVRGLPTTFVIDKHGRMAYMAVGAREWDAPGILDALLALTR